MVAYPSRENDCYKEFKWDSQLNWKQNTRCLKTKELLNNFCLTLWVFNVCTILYTATNQIYRRDLLLVWSVSILILKSIWSSCVDFLTQKTLTLRVFKFLGRRHDNLSLKITKWVLFYLIEINNITFISLA